jgi:amphi-Trp domain-containing protein
MKLGVPCRPPIAPGRRPAGRAIMVVPEQEAPMTLIEHTTKQRLRREAAAERLRELADELSRQNEIRFAREGKHYTVEVPDEVELTLEIEVGESSEIEIEISW